MVGHVYITIHMIRTATFPSAMGFAVGRPGFSKGQLRITYNQDNSQLTLGIVKGTNKSVMSRSIATTGGWHYITIWAFKISHEYFLQHKYLLQLKQFSE